MRFSVLGFLILLTLVAYGVTYYLVYIKDAPVLREEKPMDMSGFNFLHAS